MTFKELRQERGFTFRALAEKSGLGIRQLQKIEYGEAKIENITAKNLFALADALKVNPRKLMELDEPVE